MTNPKFYAVVGRFEDHDNCVGHFMAGSAKGAVAQFKRKLKACSEYNKRTTIYIDYVFSSDEPIDTEINEVDGYTTKQQTEKV